MEACTPVKPTFSLRCSASADRLTAAAGMCVAGSCSSCHRACTQPAVVLLVSFLSLQLLYLSRKLRFRRPLRTAVPHQLLSQHGVPWLVLLVLVLLLLVLLLLVLLVPCASLLYLEHVIRRYWRAIELLRARRTSRVDCCYLHE